MTDYTKIIFHSIREIKMSPKKKTKLHRKNKSHANKANTKKRFKTAREVALLLNKLEQEDSSE